MIEQMLNPSYRKFPVKMTVTKIKPYNGRLKHVNGDIMFSTSIHVATLANLKKDEARRICTATRYRLRGHGQLKSYLDERIRKGKYWSPTQVDAIVSYPLTGRYLIYDIPPAIGYYGKPMQMGIGYFLWHVAKVYKDIIYAHQNVYGVWGHAITDLYFEGIVLKPTRSKKKAVAIVEFGS